MDRNRMLYGLGNLTAEAGKRKLSEGDVAAATALFRDSARKFAYLSTIIDRPDSSLRILEMALASAVRSADHRLSFDIAMGCTKMLNGKAYEPGFGLICDAPGREGAAAGVRSVRYELHNYTYKVYMSKEQLDEIISISANSLGGITQLLAVASSGENSAVIKSGDRSYRIQIKYNTDGLVIWSDCHIAGYGEIKELINAIGESLELMLAYPQGK